MLQHPTVSPDRSPGRHTRTLDDSAPVCGSDSGGFATAPAALTGASQAVAQAGCSWSEQPTTAPKLIVVGVNGSNASTAALRWACGEASRTGAIIEVVHAFRPTPGSPAALDGARAQSSRLLSREVWVALAALSGPPSIRSGSHPGDTAAVLISRSARADLLVLGGAGQAAGGIDRSSSIATICQQNASCPVKIIHRLEPPRDRPESPLRFPRQRSDASHALTPAP